jgi:hypothetical protein
MDGAALRTGAEPQPSTVVRRQTNKHSVLLQTHEAPQFMKLNLHQEAR